MLKHARIYLAITLGIATYSAEAKYLQPGESAIVSPGDALDAWYLSGASLTVLPGATTRTITAYFSSAVTVTGATIDGGYTMGVEVSGGSSATLINTAINGAYGVHNHSGQVSLVDSTVNATEAGLLIGPQGTTQVSGSTISSSAPTTPDMPYAAVLFMGGGTVEIGNGSRLIGAGHAIGMATNASVVGPAPTTNLVIDNSSLESGTGAAISINQTIDPTTTYAADITLRNGTTVSAGNGVLLETIGPADVQLTLDSSDISGDIINGADSAAHINLTNGARLTGAMDNVTALSLSNAEWVLTNTSSVGTLNIGNGSIAFQAPDAGTYSTLNVTGDFVGGGGTLHFNTLLQGDDSPTDKLIVGGDTSGQTNVRVTNVGGAGAKTNTGVELVSVAGNSDGQFDLQGRAIGGQYEYFLVKDGNNWYLRSQSTVPPVDPCEANPTLPECGGTVPPVVPPVVPILRPEPGAYLANLAAAQGMFNLGYHDRQAGQNSGRAWARVNGSRNGFAAMSHQLDITGNSQALTVGTDLWRDEKGNSAGVMLSSGNATSTSRSDLTQYYARGKVKGEALGIYGTLRYGDAADPYAGLYIDGSAQRAQFRNRVEGLALDAERYDTRAWQGAVEAGYAFRLGDGHTSSIYIEPQLQVGYSRWDSYRHTESNGTAVSASKADGIFGKVGVRLSGVTRWGNGAAQVQPFLAVNWLHNRSEAEISMDGEAVDARIPRSRGEVSAGASVKFTNRLGLWGSLSRQQGAGYHQTSARVGLSYDW